MSDDRPRPQRHALLPPTLAPRGLSRVEAAAYIGVSGGKFDDMVADGRMPKPISVDTRRIWDRHAVDRAFDELGGIPEENPWDLAYPPEHKAGEAAIEAEHLARRTGKKPK